MILVLSQTVNSFGWRNLLKENISGVNGMPHLASYTLCHFYQISILVLVRVR